MKRIFHYITPPLLLFLMVFLSYDAIADQNVGLRTVTLQLKWKHQFQFAGYYAAIEKGFFRNAGLSVNLLEASENHDSNEAVFDGHADFGVCSSEVLILRSKHPNTVILASVFQHSPAIILALSKSGIKHARDLEGKKLSMDKNFCELTAFLASEGVSPEKYKLEKQIFDVQKLIDGEVDAMAAYATDEPFTMEEAGIGYTVMSPMMAGIDFYGDVLFTTSDLIRKDPELVRKFRQAAMEGWQYAMEHPDEIVDVIYNQYSKKNSLAYLKHEADHMKSQIMEDVVEIGYSNPQRWHEILGMLQKLNMVDNAQTNDGLLYQDYDGRAKDIPWTIVLPLLLIILIVSAVSYFFYRTSSNLRIEISKRRKIQIELAESEELYRSVVTASPDSIIITDMEGIIRLVSPVVFKMFGYPEQEILQQPMAFLLAVEDRSRALENMVQLKLGNYSGVQEYVGLRSDGTTFPIEVTGDLILPDQGIHNGMVFVSRNVSERKTAEFKLKKSEVTFRKLVESINDVIFEFSEDGTITYVSPSIEQVLGFTQDEFIGKDFFETIPESNRLIASKKLGALRKKDYYLVQYALPSKNGDLKWIRCSFSAVFEEEKRVGWIGSFNNITDYKKAEEKLLKANRFYEFISQVNQSISLIRDKEPLLKEVCRIAIDTGKFRMAWIGFINDTNNLVEPFVFAGEENGYLSIIKHISVSDRPEGRGPTGTAIREEQHYICNDIETDPNMAIWKDEALVRGYRSSIAIPIMRKGKVHGAVSLYAAQPGFFDQGEVDLLDEVTGNLSFALDAIDANQEVKDMNSNLELIIEQRTRQLEDSNKILLNEIEERNRAEGALVISEKKYKTVVENIKEVIFYTDAEGLWVFLNKSWTEITGFSLEESIGQLFVNYVYPEDRDYNMELFLPLIRREKEYCRYEVRYLTKDGGFRWIEVFARLTIEENGDVSGTYGTLRDITDHKLAKAFENELLQMSPKLTGIPLPEIDNALNLSLSRMGQFLNADRAYIFELNPETKTMSNTFEWCNKDILPEIENLQDIPLEMLPNWMNTLDRKENIVITSVVDLPDSWKAEREILEPQGIQSLIVIPMLSENNLNGFMGLDSVILKREYTVAEVNILKVWSSMLASLINNKKTELLLEQTRQNYETFFNTIDDFLWVLDEQGNIIHVNTTVKKRLEYQFDELQGKSVLMVHPPARRDEAGRIVGEMLAGTADFCPVPIVSKSGRQISVETRVKPGFWNDQPVIFGVSKDISKVELSEQKFSKAFQANSVMMSLADFDTGIFYDINNEFVEALGYSREEVIGKSSKELGLFVDPDFRPRIIENINNDTPIRKEEIKVRTKDSTIKNVLISCDAIFIGSIRYLLCATIDISDRIKAEEEIRKARFEAEQANVAKSEFLSRMSHELRTPMNSILGFAQLLEMGDLNSGQRKGVNYIIKSGKHLLDLINEVLDISRIEAGHLSLSLEPVQISEVIHEMFDLVRQQADDREIKLELIDSQENLLYIKSDKQRLKQILLNLLNNAVKYNRKGGNIFLATKVMPQNENGITPVRISVIDTGIGISVIDLPKLFNPFERIGADKTETEGTGLGLSVVKKLIGAMGGNIGVESVYGEGSTFWIEFPMSEGVKESYEEPSSSEDITLKIRHESGIILYIEDNTSNVVLVEEIVSSQRSNIRLVSNSFGLNTLPLAIEYRPDMIFLDLNLPDIHGSEVLRMLQANDETKKIPVVVISADAMPQQIAKLTEMGARRYITKPLDLDLFLNIIDEFIV